MFYLHNICNTLKKRSTMQSEMSINTELDCIAWSAICQIQDSFTYIKVVRNNGANRKKTTKFHLANCQTFSHKRT